MDFHHPLFQSLALPFGLAFGATGLLRALLGPGAGARWAATGVAVALLVGASWVLGWRWPAASLTEKLPWVYAAAAGLGLVLEALRTSRRAQWLAACVLWVLCVAVLRTHGLLPSAIALLAGGAVLGAVHNEVPARAELAAVLVVASVGLALLAMLSGSALLFELGLALGAAVGGVALWLWPVPRVAFGPAGAIVATVAWLALALATASLTTVRPAALLLLAGAFSSCALLRAARRRLRRGEGRPWAETLLVAAVAALWVAAALALAQFGGPRGGGAGPAGDDPYYTPKWQ